MHAGECRRRPAGEGRGGGGGLLLEEEGTAQKDIPRNAGVHKPDLALSPKSRHNQHPHSTIGLQEILGTRIFEQAERSVWENTNIRMREYVWENKPRRGYMCCACPSLASWQAGRQTLQPFLPITVSHSLRVPAYKQDDSNCPTVKPRGAESSENPLTN